jgi:hypothetical protein
MLTSAALSPPPLSLLPSPRSGGSAAAYEAAMVAVAAKVVDCLSREHQVQMEASQVRSFIKWMNYTPRSSEQMDKVASAKSDRVRVGGCGG